MEIKNIRIHFKESPKILRFLPSNKNIQSLIRSTKKIIIPPVNFERNFTEPEGNTSQSTIVQRKNKYFSETFQNPVHTPTKVFKSPTSLLKLPNKKLNISQLIFPKMSKERIIKNSLDKTCRVKLKTVTIAKRKVINEKKITLPVKFREIISNLNKVLQ